MQSLVHQLAPTNPQRIDINDESQTNKTSKGKWLMTWRKKIKSVFFIYSEASLAVFMLCGALIELACAVAFVYTEMPYLSRWAYVAAAILTAIAIALIYSIHNDMKRARGSAHQHCEKP